MGDSAVVEALAKLNKLVSETDSSISDDTYVMLAEGA
jgi:hypothetical protein